MASTLDDIAWPVRTERLVLRRAAPADVEATWQFRRLDAVVQWLSTRWKDLEDYRSRFEEPKRLANTLVVERGDAVIGDLMISVEDAWSQSDVADRARGVQAELGWCLHPDHHGHGYATEAVEEMLRLCFEELGLRRVVANCFADNEQSWQLMERVGMRREMHAVQESLHRSGRWLDGFSYAMLAEEWRARSSRGR